MRFEHKSLAFDVPDDVYYPAEDSMLMAEHLEKLELAGKNLLELGCGCGFLAITAAKKGASVAAADVSESAVAAARRNAQANGVRMRCFVSDLFENVDGKYDVIVFNAPYLPESEDDRHALHAEHWAGGMPVIKKFLTEAKKHLAPRGRIYFVASSLTGDVLGAAMALNYAARIVARQKIPWEELVVVEAELRGN